MVLFRECRGFRFFLLYQMRPRPVREDCRLATRKGIRPGWHMNKKYWISVYFEQDVPRTARSAENVVKASYDLVAGSLTKKKSERAGFALAGCRYGNGLSFEVDRAVKSRGLYGKKALSLEGCLFVMMSGRQGHIPANGPVRCRFLFVFLLFLFLPSSFSSFFSFFPRVFPCR